MKINKRVTGSAGYYRKTNVSSGNYLLSIKDSFSKQPAMKEDDMLTKLQSMSLERGYSGYDYGLPSNKTSYKRDVIVDSLSNGFIGGAIGYILLGQALGPIAGPIAGAAAGIYMAWDKNHSSKQGNVKIELGDKKFKEKYYLDPYSYDQSPELVKALDQSFDKIFPVNIDPDTIKNVDRETLAALKPYADKLVQLGKEKRLVASFKEKSSNQKDALHLIDSNLAKDLIASKKPVFIVNGTDVSEKTITFKATAENPKKSVFLQEAHDLLERKIDYNLTEIKSPKDLEKVKDGKGLPEGFLGVYKDENSYKETVYKISQQDYSKIGKDSRSHKFSEEEMSRVDTPSIRKSDVGSVTAHYFNLTPMGGMLGALGSYGAAIALGANPQAAGAIMIAGGFVTYQLGKRIMRNPKVSKFVKIGETPSRN